MPDIVLCADDYGLTAGVSAGILRLAALGRLSAVSCMTGRPGWPRDAAALLAHRGTIGVGLHFNLTLGKPLGPMPVLAPSGRFLNLGALMKLAIAGQVPASEIRAELGRQLDAFEAQAGGPPDFLDGHQHVHVLPGIRGVVVEELARRGLAGALWLRDPSDAMAAIVARAVSVQKALVLSGFAYGFGKAARAAGFVTNRGFSGVSPFDPTRDFGFDFRRFLERRGPAHLVMCHPGEGGDAELVGLDPVIETRPQELDYLASERFAALLKERDVQLVKAPTG